MDINELSKKAFDYLKLFYPDANNAQLEEVEITDDNKYWNITLSYESEDRQPGGLVIGFAMRSRKYKVFKIDAEKGDVRSMKIRDFK